MPRIPSKRINPSNAHPYQRAGFSPELDSMIKSAYSQAIDETKRKGKKKAGHIPHRRAHKLLIVRYQARYPDKELNLNVHQLASRYIHHLRPGVVTKALTDITPSDYMLLMRFTNEAATDPHFAKASPKDRAEAISRAWERGSPGYYLSSLTIAVVIQKPETQARLVQHPGTERYSMRRSAPLPAAARPPHSSSASATTSAQGAAVITPSRAVLAAKRRTLAQQVVALLEKKQELDRREDAVSAKKKYVQEREKREAQLTQLHNDLVATERQLITGLRAVNKQKFSQMEKRATRLRIEAEKASSAQSLALQEEALRTIEAALACREDSINIEMEHFRSHEKTCAEKEPGLERLSHHLTLKAAKLKKIQEVLAKTQAHIDEENRKLRALSAKLRVPTERLSVQEQQHLSASATTHLGAGNGGASGLAGNQSALFGRTTEGALDSSLTPTDLVLVDSNEPIDSDFLAALVS